MITDIAVDWWIGYGNLPELHVWVDYRVRERSDGTWNRHKAEKGVLYVRKHRDGRYEYMFHDPRNQRGFGGRVFVLTMRDGSEQKVKGPWSSNAGAVGAILGVPLIEVILHDASGGLFVATFKMKVLKKAIKTAGVVDLDLGEVQYPDGVTYWGITTPKPKGEMAPFGTRPTLSAIPLVRTDFEPLFLPNTD